MQNKECTVIEINNIWIEQNYENNWTVSLVTELEILPVRSLNENLKDAEKSFISYKTIYDIVEGKKMSKTQRPNKETRREATFERKIVQYFP